MASQTVINTRVYNRFAGVDFSTDPSKVSDNRSPYARNIISDDGGYPEKRVGWRKLLRICDAEDGNITCINFVTDTDKYSLIAPQGSCSSELIEQEYGEQSVKFLAMSISEREQQWGIKIAVPESGTYIASITGFNDESHMGMKSDVYLNDAFVGNFNFSEANRGSSYAEVRTINYFNEFEMPAGDNTLWFKCANDIGVPPSQGYKNRINLISISFIRVDAHPLPINSISYFAKAGCYLVHAGSNLYKWLGGTDVPQRLCTNVNNAKSKTLVVQGKMLILTGEQYLIFDGERIISPFDNATVPYIIAGRGAGEMSSEYVPAPGNTYQPINMLTNKVKIGFTVPEGGTDVIGISGLGLISIERVSRIDTDGSEVDVDIDSIDNMSKITTAKPLPASLPIGTDTVFVYGEIASQVDRVSKCTIMGEYQNRVFFSGNPSYPNIDWHSQLNDPFFVSDLSYTNVGAIETNDDTSGQQLGEDGVAIAGYARLGDCQIVLKHSHGQESAVLFRSSQLTENERIFPIAQSIVGEGVVAADSIAILNDDPLFLTQNGVCAIASRDVTSEKILVPRSSRINARLCKEENLENAKSAVWNGYYLLFINGNVYVADSRQKTYLREGSEAFEYEWYFWDNVNVQAVHSHGDVLYFGDDEGYIYRFNTDMKSPRGGYLMEAYNDGGEPIVAEWSTALSDDGDFNRLKILRRRGSGVHIKSYDHGNLEICFATDHDFETRLNYRTHGIFNFENLSFEHFTFNTYPHGFIPFDGKVKDYRLIQIICRNAELNQGFGVYGIERRFVYGYNAK